MSSPPPSLDKTVAQGDLAASLQQTLAELPSERMAVLSRTIERNPRSTIEPDASRSDALGRVALEDLGTAGAAREIGASVVLEETIGEGGMGVVRLATQRSLGRKVAVKTLRPEARTERAVLRLLREAWVTGALEHPNIVPVYDLGLDEGGAPIILLKRIEGSAWSTLLHDAEAVKERFGGADLLENNLRILVQLCNAVALAHARGILHRDLKPENVMIGRFGEVYLVDWGVAVTMAPDPTGRLPTVRGEGDMAGTPVYMAPEMLGTGAPLSERTDVYLLGAILHEILTGKPPHDGESFRAIVASILKSTPVYPPEAPRDLVAIATKAMRFDPAERFASADELRARLEWYLRHRGSLALSDAASRRLAALREQATDASGGAARDRIHRLFAEGRFGFRQALAASPDNEAAREGLRELTELVVAWELDHGTADGAAAALAELEDPPPDIVARVAAAQASQAARAARLDALERDLDPAVGRRTRAFVVLLLGLLWSVVPLVVWRLDRPMGRYGPRAMYVGSGVLVAIVYALTTWARDSLSKSLVNRRAVATIRLSFGAQLALEIALVARGATPQLSLVLHFFVWFFGASAFALFVDTRLWPAALAYLLGFFATALFPEWGWPLASCANFLMLLTAVRAWRAHDDWAFVANRFRERVAKRRR